MREIEFRGINKETGKWIYGALLRKPAPPQCIGNKKPDKYFIQFVSNNYMPDWNMPYAMEEAEIITKTIGQYIGLKDRKGKKIYEGDIVEWNYRGINRAVVFWDNMKAGFYLCALNSYKWHIEHTSYIRQEFVNAKNKTIIGNIIDNPELLEE